MTINTETIFQKLIEKLSTLPEVASICISGSKTPLPQAGEGDIDLFIYCDTIPSPERRQSVIDQMGDLAQDGRVKVFAGGHWGEGDFLRINGVETWLMYFTQRDVSRNVDAILNGDFPDKLDNYYYPIGRCAMLQSCTVLYDPGDYLHSLKEKLRVYPAPLAEKLAGYHLKKLADVEDMQRAAARKDVLFYHFALEIAIDHFLQALFALNRTFFPSRKRSLLFLARFDVQPADCANRLLEVLRLGGAPEGIPQSYALWAGLVEDLQHYAAPLLGIGSNPGA
jgi:hypothetical protein